MLIAALALSGCSPTSAVDAGQTSDVGATNEPSRDTVTVAWTTDYTSLDPIRGGTWNWEAQYSTYETLLNYAYTETDSGSYVWEGNDVAAGLASEWEVVDNTITLQLREDAVFYPSGNPVTANDVKWSFDRALNHPGEYGVYNFHLAGIFDVERQVQIIDDHTVAISFEDDQGQPLLTASSVASLRFHHFSIIDSVAAREHVTDADPWASDYLHENTLGSGPYFIESHTADTETVFAAVPGYYRGEPEVKTVVARVVGDADPTALIKTGEVDLVRTNLTTQQLDELADSGFNVVTEETPDILRLTIAVDDERLADERVRQAIAYAVPYESINELIYSGRAQRAYSFVNAKANGWYPAWDIYDTDLDAARKLLSEAGVASLTIPLYYNNAGAGYESLALLLQESLAEIGITLELIGQIPTVYSEQTTLRNKGEASEHSGITITSGAMWLDDPDVNVEREIRTGGNGNWAHYSNAEVDQLHDEYRYSTDTQSRADAYQRLQEITAKEVPVVPLLLPGRSVALTAGVQGYTFAPDAATRFEYLNITSD